MDDLKHLIIVVLVLLALVFFVLQGTRETDARVDAEFQYRYQN